MNKQLKNKWIEALESGKYRRADGQLKKGRGYCCLGVLCAITKTDFDPKDSYLPDELAQRAGLDALQMTALAALNDGELDAADRALLKLDDDPPGYKEDKGASFRVIASVIRDAL